MGASDALLHLPRHELTVDLGDGAPGFQCLITRHGADDIAREDLLAGAVEPEQIDIVAIGEHIEVEAAQRYRERARGVVRRQAWLKLGPVRIDRDGEVRACREIAAVEDGQRVHRLREPGLVRAVGGEVDEEARRVRKTRVATLRGGIDNEQSLAVVDGVVVAGSVVRRAVQYLVMEVCTQGDTVESVRRCRFERDRVTHFSITADPTPWWVIYIALSSPVVPFSYSLSYGPC